MNLLLLVVLSVFLFFTGLMLGFYIGKTTSDDEEYDSGYASGRFDEKKFIQDKFQTLPVPGQIVEVDTLGSLVILGYVNDENGDPKVIQYINKTDVPPGGVRSMTDEELDLSTWSCDVAIFQAKNIDYLRHS